MKKILILGISGFAGLEIAKKLVLENKVIGTYYHNKPEIKNCELIQMDVTSNKILNSLLENKKPDLIINCVAISNIDECEMNHELCRKINVLPTEVIVEYCKRNPKTKYVFLSSSQVFGGDKTKVGAYSKDDPCHPINYYGKCKLECENIIRKLKNHVIIRPCLIFGLPKKYQHKTIFNYIYDALSVGDIFTAHFDQIKSPVFVQDVALLTKNIIEKEKTGIFHAGGKTRSIYDFTIEVAKFFSFNTNLVIIKKSEEKSYRSKNNSLDCTFTEQECGFIFKPLEESLYNSKRVII